MKVAAQTRPRLADRPAEKPTDQVKTELLDKDRTIPLASLLRFLYQCYEDSQDIQKERARGRER